MGGCMGSRKRRLEMARTEEVYERFVCDARALTLKLRDSTFAYDDLRRVILELEIAEANGKVKGAWTH